MSDVTIRVSSNGSLMVKGPVNLVDEDGKAWDLESETIFLCRCGNSSNMPFCDSSHKKTGFTPGTYAP